MADVKFSQFANGGEIQAGDIIVGLRGGVNTKFDSPADPGSEFLLKANNLDDVDDTQTSVANLGFGNGQILQLNDASFSGGIYTLTNPCPNFIQIQCNTPGNQLRLPPAQGLGAFSLSFGPQLTSTGTEDVSINLNSGASFTTLISNGGFFVKLSDNSTSDGSWIAVATVTALNGVLTGTGNIESSDGSIDITPSPSANSIDLSVSFLTAPARTITNSMGFPNISLGNPLRYYNFINFSVFGVITLPAANTVNSITLGYPIYFKNISQFSAVIGDAGGTDLITLNPGDFYMLQLDTNSTSDGTYVVTNLTSGFNFNDVISTSAQTYANNIYMANNSSLVTLALPNGGLSLNISAGERIKVVGKGSGGWTITQTGAQFIHLGNSTTTIGAGGSLSSTNQYDSVEILCLVDNLEFTVTDVIGTITII